MVSMDEHSKAGPKAEETQKKQPEKRTRMIQPAELTLEAYGAKFKNPQEENRGLNVLSLLHCHPAVMIMLLFLRPCTHINLALSRMSRWNFEESIADQQQRRLGYLFTTCMAL